MGHRKDAIEDKGNTYADKEGLEMTFVCCLVWCGWKQTDQGIVHMLGGMRMTGGSEMGRTRLDHG